MPPKMIKIFLPQDGRLYEVPRDELLRTTWGQRTLTTGSPSITVPNLRAPVFNLFALWLNHLPLSPELDISMRSPKPATSPTAYTGQASSVMVTVNTQYMSSEVYDDTPNQLAPARRLVLAYLLGQEAGAPYFQDAVMNQILERFAPDQHLPVALFKWVYDRTPDGTRGIRKFLVDYFIWCSANDDIQLQAAKYSPQFEKDVKETLKAQEKMEDVVVDFGQVWEFLKNKTGGGLTHRYHLHGKDEVCFNHIV